MITEQQKELESEISAHLDRLLAIISKSSTESVLGWCFGNQFSTSHKIGNEERLASPAKQIPFLLSLMLSTPIPGESHSLTEEEWRQVKTLLDRLFHAYMGLYWPSKEQIGALSDEWRRSREVSMMAFLHFFNTGLLASVEQITDRIRRYLAPFDDELKKTLGLSATDALEISKWISNTLQRDLDNLQKAAIEENAARQTMLARAKLEKWSLAKLKEVAADPAYFDKASKMLHGIQGIGRVSIVEVRRTYPDTTSAFLSIFSIERGDAPPLRYPTEESIYSSRPLVKISDKVVMCLSSNVVTEAILNIGEKTLIKSSARESYLRARDKELEKEALEHIQALVDSGAQIYSEIFETPDSQFEHDLIVEDAVLQIALEAKASPPNEPFRDPDKAFPRLRDAFRGDTGIQKAFAQGNRIVRRLKNNETVPLYNRKGTQVAELKPEPGRLPVCICVTRDNFGGLATKLSLLLEKEDSDSFPWAVNIFDLANLAMAWKYFKWGSKEFRRYLEQRALLHHKGFADDELDFAGYFIRHGDFKHALESKADLFQFNPEYSSLFDDLYRYIHRGGPPVEVKQTEPVMMDLRKSLKSNRPVLVDPNTLEIFDPDESPMRKARSRARKRKEKEKARTRKKSKARNRKKKL